MGRKLNLPTRYCESCGIAIIRNTSGNLPRINTKQYVKTRFCSLICKGIKQSENLKGKNNPNYKGGKTKCSDCAKELYARFLDPKRCRQCYIAHSKKSSPNYPKCVNCTGKTGDYKSVLCKNCYRGALRPFWKGGVSTIQALVRGLPENRQWQKQCMYRDRWSCTECGDERNLQVHHIKSFALILKENDIKTVEQAKNCVELWDMDNGQTLCKECHKLTSNYSKKL